MAREAQLRGLHNGREGGMRSFTNMKGERGRVCVQKKRFSLFKMVEGGGGAKTFNPVLRGDQKVFGPAIFLFCSPSSL